MRLETSRTIPLTCIDMHNEVIEAKKIAEDARAADANRKNADQIALNADFIHNVDAVDIAIPKVIGLSNDKQQVAVTDFRIARVDGRFTIGFKYAIGDGPTKLLSHKCSPADHEYIGDTLLNLPSVAADNEFGSEIQISIEANLHNFMFGMTLSCELFSLQIAMDVESDIGYPD
jgi:hypothetical protein